ncbi:MAG: glycosyltransferase family 4 protein [Patescibacteria group bacterium]
MPKRIAIISCAWPPQGGGIGNYAYQQAKELSELGYLVTAFTPKFKQVKEFQSGDFKLELLPVFLPLGHAGFLFGLFKKLRALDLVHLHYPFFGSDLIVLAFKFFYPEKKLILHYHMDVVGCGFKRIIFKVYLKLFLGLAVMLSDKIIIATADYLEHSYLKKYLSKYRDKISIIPYGVETDIFRPRPKNHDLATRYGIKENDSVLIFISFLDRQHYFKGLEVLFSALAQLIKKQNGLKLLVVGEGEMKERYRQMAHDLGVSGNIVFTGFVQDLAEVISLANIFVLPSTDRAESFGLVTAEAQSCGLPAIVSDLPGVREAIKNGETGLLVDPGSVDDLVDKLNQLLSDHALRSKFGSQARGHIVNCYSWKIIIQKLDSLYKTLI